ncbi:MAG: hypothetical protein ACYC3X_00540 [Pirellulaceae bacterium]
MAHSTALKHLAVLALLTFVAGCALPPARHEPASIAAAVNPSGTFPASVSGARTNPVSAISQIAYETPAVVPPEPQVTPHGLVPRPENVLPGQRPPAPMAQQAAEPSAESLPATYHSDDLSDPLSGQVELSVDQLVAEVQARNPSLQAAAAAWRAAVERYPQMVSLDDPMFTYNVSPQGIGMDDGGGWMVQASQEVPWAATCC